MKLLSYLLVYSTFALAGVGIVYTIYYLIGYYTNELLKTARKSFSNKKRSVSMKRVWKTRKSNMRSIRVRDLDGSVSYLAIY